MTDEVRAALVEMLAQVYKPEGVRIWMTVPHRQWGDLTVEQMAEAGRFDEVWNNASGLADGSFA